MIYGGETLHGNNPEDWETISILRSSRLGLYADGLEDVYEKNLHNAECADENASHLYMLLYPSDLKERQIEGNKRAYAKANRIERALC